MFDDTNMNQNSGENVENEIGPLYFLMSVLTRESNNVNEYDVCVCGNGSGC